MDVADVFLITKKIPDPYFQKHTTKTASIRSKNPKNRLSQNDKTLFGFPISHSISSHFWAWNSLLECYKWFSFAPKKFIQNWLFLRKLKINWNRINRILARITFLGNSMDGWKFLDRHLTPRSNWKKTSKSSELASICFTVAKNSNFLIFSAN